MVKGTHKLFKAVFIEILQALPIFGESRSEISYLILEAGKFAEVTRLSKDINKPWLKSTLKDITNLINNKSFLFQEPEKGEPVTPCIYVYKEKIQSDGSLNKLKLRIVVREDIFRIRNYLETPGHQQIS